MFTSFDAPKGWKVCLRVDIAAAAAISGSIYFVIFEKVNEETVPIQ